MNNDLIEELKIYQDIIKRLAENSFKIKAWTVTLIVGILLFKEIDNELLLISTIPVISFWYIDSYYVYLERFYRDTYTDIVLHKNPKRIPFLIPGTKASFKKTAKTMFSSFSVSFFYVVIILIIVTYIKIKNV